ncbi:hypothetical protein KIH74_05640 [Kineosporia sp. J2-2]|uniref:Cep57 centrosome localisation domain-containing protein n=1 Tax=Kineosporia corallincola TaxID=2835133 RepID=A0ABS5TBI3_9ACTN|nr:hypothetical protein [Kineosporia corallincola]MBT0768396.1 hypothetical protein [Kineosporia corallincola]
MAAGMSDMARRIGTLEDTLEITKSPPHDRLSRMDHRIDNTVKLFEAHRDDMKDLQRSVFTIEKRTLLLERNVDRIRIDVEGMRRDNASMHEDITDIIKRLDRHDARFDQQDKRFDTLEQRFDTLEQRFDTLEQRFDTLEQRVDTLSAEVTSIRLTQDKMLANQEALAVMVRSTQDNISAIMKHIIKNN